MSGRNGKQPTKKLSNPSHYQQQQQHHRLIHKQQQQQQQHKGSATPNSPTPQTAIAQLPQPSLTPRPPPPIQPSHPSHPSKQPFLKKGSGLFRFYKCVSPLAPEHPQSVTQLYNDENPPHTPTPHGRNPNYPSNFPPTNNNYNSQGYHVQTPRHAPITTSKQTQEQRPNYKGTRRRSDDSVQASTSPPPANPNGTEKYSDDSPIISPSFRSNPPIRPGDQQMHPRQAPHHHPSPNRRKGPSMDKKLQEGGDSRSTSSSSSQELCLNSNSNSSHVNSNHSYALHSNPNNSTNNSNQSLPEFRNHQVRLEGGANCKRHGVVTSQIDDLQYQLHSIQHKITLLERNRQSLDTFSMTLGLEGEEPGEASGKEEGVKAGGREAHKGNDRKAGEGPTQVPDGRRRGSEQGDQGRATKEMGRMGENGTLESIDQRLTALNVELVDMQSCFGQKLEALEEGVHIKSQRWCENQIKVADQVHSLFAELDLLRCQVKGQEEHVQNLAENVDKELQAIRSECRTWQEVVEERIRLLEQRGNEPLSTNRHSPSASEADVNNNGNGNGNGQRSRSVSHCEWKHSEERVATAGSRDTATDTGTSRPIEARSSATSTSATALPRGHTDQVGQRNNQGSQMSGPGPEAVEREHDLEREVTGEGGSREVSRGTGSGPGLVSSRRTLPNGDTETTYANGTRELMKADQSEVRHVYRNGDVRTLLPDGSVTYFYRNSNTFQTTLTNGTELFRFPNGLIERRLPHGLIEQTDVNGHVTLFTANPRTLPNHSPLSLATRHHFQNQNHYPHTPFQSHSSNRQSPVATAERGNLSERLPPTSPRRLQLVHPLQLGAGFLSESSNHHHPHPLPSHHHPLQSPSSRHSRRSGGEGTDLLLRRGMAEGGVALAPDERIVVFGNGEEEIHGPDYRKRIFGDGTVKTVYSDGSQETRYPNGRIRIKDGDGHVVADVTIPPTTQQQPPDVNINYQHPGSSQDPLTQDPSSLSRYHHPLALPNVLFPLKKN